MVIEFFNDDADGEVPEGGTGGHNDHADHNDQTTQIDLPSTGFVFPDPIVDPFEPLVPPPHTDTPPPPPPPVTEPPPVHVDNVINDPIPHVDNVPIPAPPPAPAGLTAFNVIFDPGGAGPEPFNTTVREQETGTRKKAYTVSNRETTPVSLTFTGIPNGVTVSPTPITINPDDTAVFIVEMTNEYLASLEVGRTTKTLGIQVVMTTIPALAHVDIVPIQHADHLDGGSGNHTDHTDTPHQDDSHSDHVDHSDVIHNDHGDHNDSPPPPHNDHIDHGDHADHVDHPQGDEGTSIEDDEFDDTRTTTTTTHVDTTDSPPIFPPEGPVTSPHADHNDQVGFGPDEAAEEKAE
jgi:hypothetical protein